MSRAGIFGWSLPPGVTNRMIEEQCEDHPCAVCGYMPDTCTCPECSQCGEIGKPECYREHGMKLSREQYVGRMMARIEMLRTQIVDEEMYLAHVVDGGEFSEDIADSPDPWR